MKIPLVDLKAQYDTIKPEIDTSIQRVLDKTSFILGDEVAAFEAAFAKVVGANGAVGVGSGTAALQLAMLACGIGPGDEVITSAHTFIATAEAISHTGARPVFVDIDARSFNLDPNQVEKAVSSRTRAILPVHLYGQPADLDPLLDIEQSKDLWLIEDAAQAHAAEYKGRRCGSIGHIACFSFYPGKNLGAYGDAGAVTSNDESLLAKVRKLHNHGRTTKYEHDEIGWGERLDALQAAVLGAKLPHLESWTEARRSHARIYSELLAGCDVTTPYESPDARHVYHLYVIRSRHRNDLLDFLKTNGVDAGIHYPIPLHRQPAYAQQGYSDVRLPVSEQAAAEVLSLPMYPELNEAQIHYVAEVVRQFHK
ncbi:MAG TPA: DegT/DnrJ/EryC1/StrS family aminotransferase [Blastocatellia bacterium]|nr:DegT/DnrJ/EryC1/StrS family aminotransferase [Blastocatellia bacterium]